MPLLKETNDILKYMFLTVTHKGGQITSSDSSTGFADACTLSDAPSTDLHSKEVLAQENSPISKRNMNCFHLIPCLSSMNSLAFIS